MDQQRRSEVLELLHEGDCTDTSPAASPDLPPRPATVCCGTRPTLDRMARLHVVTGKGGTGKTTVAAAMALALAEQGQRILLVEVEGRQGLAQLFDVPPLPYVERRIAQGPDGGEVFALAVDAEAALLEYLDMYYHLGRAGKALEKVGAIDFVTTIAPGLRDVLLTGKVYEATRRKAHGKLAYDAVVLDAPPTGRIVPFLNVNHEVAGLAKVGPIRNQADAIMGMLRSDVTRIHLVTLLEEMPVQETLDAVGQLEAIDLRIGSIVVNMVRHSPLDDDALALAVKEKLPATELTEGLRAAGITGGAELVGTLAAEAHDHAIRVGLERENRDRIDALGKKVVELELQPEGIDNGALFDLAEELRHERARPGCPDRRSGDADHRHLRGGRRRQDDHGGRAGAARGRARAEGRRTHDRPGPAAGAVARADRTGQHPAGGGRGERRERRPAGRDDAGHEADVRRRRAAARDPGEGRADPCESVLPSVVVVLRGDAGVHGDGEARAAAQAGRADRRLGPDRRRHPAVALGAGLPGRPGAAGVVAGRPVPATAAGPGARAVQVDVRGRQHGDVGAEQGAGRSGADRRTDVRRGVRHVVRWVPAAGGADRGAAAGVAHRVPGGGRAAERCAARGVVLRRAVAGGGNATGRRGAEPSDDHAGSGVVRGAVDGRGREARGSGQVAVDRRRTAVAREQDAAGRG